MIEVAVKLYLAHLYERGDQGHRDTAQNVARVGGAPTQRDRSVESDDTRHGRSIIDDDIKKLVVGCHPSAVGQQLCHDAQEKLAPQRLRCASKRGARKHACACEPRGQGRAFPQSAP